MNLLWSQMFVVGLTLAGIVPVLSQDLPGNIRSGKRIAEMWCSACHRIDPNVVVIDPVPDFYSIANLSSSTALSLKVFLETSHENMPNFHLMQADKDDVIAYILSLKKK